MMLHGIYIMEYIYMDDIRIKLTNTHAPSLIGLDIGSILVFRDVFRGILLINEDEDEEYHGSINHQEITTACHYPFPVKNSCCHSQTM